MRKGIVLTGSGLLAVLVPLVLAQWLVVEETKFTAPVPVPGDRLGHAVALSGDTAVLGVPLDDHAGSLTDAGAVFVYVRSGASWVLQAELRAALPAQRDEFGAAVALDGDTLVIGAPLHNVSGMSNAGAAYLFTRSGSSWTQQAQLVASSPGVEHRFGRAVALDGDTFVVGAPGQQGWVPTLGQAFVYVRSVSGLWSEQAALVSGWGKARFGAAVAIEGDRAVIGAPRSNVAHAFSRNGAVWTLDQTLWGRNANATGSFDGFGFALDISGETLVVGAPSAWVNKSAAGYEAGAVHVFEHDGTQWHLERGLAAKVPIFGQGLGGSVSIDGDVLVAGATGTWYGGMIQQSLTFVFVRSGTTWSQQRKFQSLDFQDRDGFGFSVAIAGTSLLVGSPLDDHPGVTDAGSAYVYQVSQPGPVNYCQAGLSASGCAASLSTVGNPSASALSGFQLLATNVEGARPGLFLYTTYGRKFTAWGNGTSLRCIATPAHKSAVLSGVGTLGACDGSFSLDLNAVWCPTCPQPTHNPGAGSGVQAQLWYRDPMSTSNQTTSFSDAIEFWIEP